MGKLLYICDCGKEHDVHSFSTTIICNCGAINEIKACNMDRLEEVNQRFRLEISRLRLELAKKDMKKEELRKNWNINDYHDDYDIIYSLDNYKDVLWNYCIDDIETVKENTAGVLNFPVLTIWHSAGTMNSGFIYSRRIGDCVNEWKEKVLKQLNEKGKKTIKGFKQIKVEKLDYSARFPAEYIHYGNDKRFFKITVEKEG